MPFRGRDKNLPLFQNPHSIEAFVLKEFGIIPDTMTLLLTTCSNATEHPALFVHAAIEGVLPKAAAIALLMTTPRSVRSQNASATSRVA